jgi:hypothetical protein
MDDASSDFPKNGVPPQTPGGPGSQPPPPEPGEEPTEVAPAAPDEAATLASPAPAEETTHVMSADDTGETAVMAAGGAAAPPSPTAKGSSRAALWVIVAGAGVVIVAVLVWFLFFRGGNGDKFVGTWAPVDGSYGGLVIKKSGGAFDVTLYSAAGEVFTLTAKLKGGKLSGSIVPGGQSAIAGFTSEFGFTIDYLGSRDHILLRTKALGKTGQAIEFERVVTLELISPSPSASPSRSASPSPSGSPSPSPSTSGSPSPSPSPSSTGITGKDLDVVNGILAIQVGILTYAQNHNNAYPQAGDVAQTGAVGQYVHLWPTNPFTNQPMISSSSEGDYTYTLSVDGKQYHLTGHLENGNSYAVP